MKNITLILEYDIGDFPDDVADYEYDDNIFEEIFYQGDAVVQDMKIVGIKVKEVIDEES